MERNFFLSLRTPEATSLACTTASNKHNVDNFFHNLQTAMQKQNNEISLTMVVRPPKVITPEVNPDFILGGSFL